MTSKALKRIKKDLNELLNNPLNGVSITIPDENNLFELHGNILISDGIYLHTFIHIPPEYPEVGYHLI